MVKKETRNCSNSKASSKLIQKLLLILLFLFFSFYTFSQSPTSGCGGGGDGSGPGGGGGGIGGGGGNGGNGDNGPAHPPGMPFSIQTLHATDPNEIQGPLGVTIKKWMARKDKFGFTVRFENDPDFATGPAQKVLVTVPIDSTFDINSLRLGNFGFGNMIFIIPPNSPTYYHRLDLRDSLGLYVDVLAGIDVINHQAIWAFESIDPATGAEPLDPSLGFLPVRDTSINRFNDSIPNKGEGFVSYSIKPKTTAQTGDTVKAQAGIIFDINAPVYTNIEHNTIDAFAPTSHAVSATQLHDTIFVNWLGQDDPGGVGVKEYALYVSINSAPFTLYKNNIQSLSAPIAVIAGNTYGFFTLATDSVGNAEPLKNRAETTILAGSEDCSISATAVASNSVCSAENGSVNLTVTGGTPPYSYLWSNGNTTEDITNLIAGTYSVTATDANGCTDTTSAIVNNIAGPAVSITGTTHVLCFGQSTGSINITITGGTAPLSYLWSNGAITEDVSGLAAGTYSVIITDANGCTASVSTAIMQPLSALSASSTAPPITTTGGSTTVMITATGGTEPYTGTGTFTRTAGTYTFTVTDANGCTATTTIVITEPGCSITLSSTTINVSCFGRNNGAIDLTVNGASGAVTYSWSNGATTQDLNGLTAGTYTVTVKDTRNCTATATITIIQPASSLVITANAPAIPCGETTTTVTVSATGGTAPYAGTGTFTRAPGTYIFIVTDARGCTASTTIVIANAGLTVNAGPDKDLCNGPVILTATVSGAITNAPPPFTPFNEVPESTADKRIFAGNIDYITIGKTFSQSENRNNCNKNSTASKTLTLPAGAVVKRAYLYWSGSGNIDNTIKLNGETITAGNTKTYSMPGNFRFFSARANVTNKVSDSGIYTVSDLSWNNGSPYCLANSAYGGWAMTVVYELPSLPIARIHINTEKFQYTYPAGNYSTTINNISLPAGCSSGAKLTIVGFEGDNYSGESLTIGGQNFGNNNFRGQSGPNLDIPSWDIPALVTSGNSSLTYTINAYQSNTAFGQAVDGLFDYVKILKYKTCPPACNGVSYRWSTGATTQSITVTQPGAYYVRVTDCSTCIAKDTVNVTNCPPVDPDKCYRLIARHSGKALTIQGGSTVNGGNAEQRTYNDGNNQKWKFEEVETGYYKVTNVNSNLILDVAGGGTANGTNIQQWTWDGDDDQRWKMDKNAAGYYGVQAKHSGKYMGVENSSTVNGANVEQRGNNANDYNRQWDISEVGCPNANLRTTEIIVSKEAAKDGDDVKETKVTGDFIITVHPNPGSTFFNLTISSSDKATPVNVRIADVNGKIVSEHQNKSPNNMLTINAEKWPNGVYIAEVIQGNRRKAIRLVKSN